MINVHVNDPAVKIPIIFAYNLSRIQWNSITSQDTSKFVVFIDVVALSLFLTFGFICDLLGIFLNASMCAFGLQSSKKEIKNISSIFL